MQPQRPTRKQPARQPKRLGNTKGRRIWVRRSTRGREEKSFRWGKVSPLDITCTKKPLFLIQPNFFWQTISVPNKNSQTFFCFPFGNCPLPYSPSYSTNPNPFCLPGVLPTNSLILLAHLVSLFTSSGWHLKCLLARWSSFVAPTLVNRFFYFRRCHPGASLVLRDREFLKVIRVASLLLPIFFGCGYYVSL